MKTMILPPGRHVAVTLKKHQRGEGYELREDDEASVSIVSSGSLRRL